MLQGTTSVIIALVLSLVGIGFVIWQMRRVLAEDQGNQTMREISLAIQVGASAFLRREYTYLAGFVVIVALIVGAFINWQTAVNFVVGALISTSVSGKVIAMWMPIMLFFYMVFEHSIVNMFLFPSGLMLGAKFSILDYLIWNEIPTVLGNLVGGLAFTGLTLYATHVRTAPKRAM